MAGTILANAKKIRDMIEVRLVCECDGSADTGTPAVLNTLPGMIDIIGSKLYLVSVWPGVTAPTDASDLTITDADGIDLLGARGTDLIDATSKTSCCAGTTNNALPMPVTGPLKITITNNAVNSAVIHMRLLFVMD